MDSEYRYYNRFQCFKQLEYKFLLMKYLKMLIINIVFKKIKLKIKKKKKQLLTCL